MKKCFFHVIILIFSVTISFISCGSKVNQKVMMVKGADGTEYTSYQECCAANDYEAAHLYLAKMQSEKPSELYEATDYVFKHEALFLMSQGDDASKKRLIYLLKEEGDNNSRVAMLIDLAIENDDDTFVKQLANQYKEGADEDNLEKLTDYLLKKDDNNKEFVVPLLKKLELKDLLCDIALKSKDTVLLLSVTDDFSIDDTKMVEALAAMNNKKMSGIIISALAKEGNVGSRPALGIVKSDDYGEIPGEYNAYRSHVSSFNDQCKSVLAIAVKYKNMYLAQQSIGKVKTNIQFIDLGDWCKVVEKNDYRSIYEAWKVSLDNTEVVEAKSILINAIRSGTFN